MAHREVGRPLRLSPSHALGQAVRLSMCCAVCHTAGVFVRFFARPKKLTEETALLKRRRGYRFIRQRGFL